MTLERAGRSNHGLSAASRQVVQLSVDACRLRPATPAELAAAAALGVVMLVGGQALRMLGILSAARRRSGSVHVKRLDLLALFAWVFLREPLGLQEVDGVAPGFAVLR